MMVMPEYEVGSSGCKSRIAALFCYVQSVFCGNICSFLPGGRA